MAQSCGGQKKLSYPVIKKSMGSAMPNKERRTELGQTVARQPTEE